jgi:hypothetical protein
MFPSHSDPGIQGLIADWDWDEGVQDILHTMKVQEGLHVFKDLSELNGFFATVTRAMGVNDFSRRYHRVTEPHYGSETSLDLVEYIHGVGELSSHIEDTETLGAVSVCLRKQFSTLERMYPGSGSLSAWKRIPLEYTHEFFDYAPENRFIPHATLVARLWKAGVPAKYAGTIPMRIDDGGVNSPEGYSTDDIIALYASGIPAEYARDAVPHGGRFSAYRIAALYRRDVPAEYASATHSLASLDTIDAWISGLPAEYALAL